MGLAERGKEREELLVRGYPFPLRVLDIALSSSLYKELHTHLYFLSLLLLFFFYFLIVLALGTVNAQIIEETRNCVAVDWNNA